MKLIGKAKEAFNRIVQEQKIAPQHYDTLEMGCWYLGEWYRMAEQSPSLTVHDSKGDVDRSNPAMRYMKFCFESWLAVADRYGLHPYGLKKVAGADQRPAKTSTKGRVQLRKLT